MTLAEYRDVKRIALGELSTGTMSMKDYMHIIANALKNLADDSPDDYKQLMASTEC